MFPIHRAPARRDQANLPRFGDRFIHTRRRGRGQASSIAVTICHIVLPRPRTYNPRNFGNRDASVQTHSVTFKQTPATPFLAAAARMLFAAIAAGALLSFGEPIFAQAEEVGEIRVIGRQEFLATQFSPQRQSSGADSAQLINRVPGGGANKNGPLTGQIQYRGMFGPRINVRIDGMLIHGGGPNWMAPPLHHIPAALMEGLVVERGIASIATGGGIGGATTASWKHPDYGQDAGWNWRGDGELSGGSAADSTSSALIFGGVNANHRVFGIGSFDRSGNQQSANGEVAATQYHRAVYGVGYGYRSGVHEIHFDAHRIETEDSGTPTLPMDIDWFDTDTVNFRYSGQFGGLGAEVGVYRSSIDHGMSNFLLRSAPDFSALPLPPFVGDDKRFAAAASEEYGFRLAFDIELGPGLLRFGAEGKNGEHDVLVSDPDFAPFFVENFSGVETDGRSLFAQWSAILREDWYLEVGGRVEQVDMSAGAVDAFPARLVDMNPARWGAGTPPRAVWLLRENFNSAEREQSDDNHDLVAKLRYQLTPTLVVEAGYGRKTRSPLYQERYLWIPLEINAGLGDGNNYVGNPDLRPETSDQFELGFDWSDGSAWFSPRFFVRDVDDYIQGVTATNMAVVGVSRNANGDPTPLMFANTAARFRGFDLNFGFALNPGWRVEGTASHVKAEREDVADYLYRINPDNARVSLIYESGAFSARLEQVAVLEQERISRANTFDPANPKNNADPTDGYHLTNVYVDWRANQGFTLTLGAENLFDTDYVDHLTGFNRVPGGAVPVGSRMYGQGTNLFGRIQFRW